MRTTIIAAILAAMLLPAGCGKKASRVTSNPSAAAAVAEPVLTLWQKGDKSAAVSKFVETDWSSRPLFTSNSGLEFNEEHFSRLSIAEQKALTPGLLSQLASIRELAKAVSEAGRNAAAKGEASRARQHFISIKEFGSGLDTPNSMRIVQLTGQALKRMADAELTNIGR